MSFRTAYSSFKYNRISTNSRGLIRDKTPEEQKKMMDEYYKQMRNYTPSNGRK